MKKIYLALFTILFWGSFSISVYAQGTWKTTGTEAAVMKSTAITTGIAGITCMHSDVTNVIGKSDVSTTSTVVYHGVTWDNQGILQGSNNGMYYAFRTTKSGVLDISIKMGSAKATFLLELSSACPDNADLAALTTNMPTGDLITTVPAYFTTPSVYDTYHLTNGTWDGSTAFQSTGSNVYMVMSLNVAANKTYIVGCFGSKLMLRGVHFTITTPVKQIPADNGVSFNGTQIVNEKGLKLEVYNDLGKLITRSSSSISTYNLPKGVYIVRIAGSNGVLKFSK